MKSIVLRFKNISYSIIIVSLLIVMVYVTLMSENIFIPISILILIVIVIIFKTLTIAPVSVYPEIQSNLSIDEDLAVQRLSSAIQYRTISHEDSSQIVKPEFLGFHVFLEKAFPYTHKTLKRERISELSLLYKWEGTEKKSESILFAAHMDVAPVDNEIEASESWEFPPFSGKIHHGYIYGRGTLDMKSQLMGILEAIEALVKKGYKPRKSIYLAFGHDEEIGGKDGNSQIASYLASQGIIFSAVFDEGGFIIRNIISGIASPIALIGVAEKGFVTVELSAYGTGGHSSLPPRYSVISKLARAIYKLEKNRLPAKLNKVTRLFFNTLAGKMSFLKKVIFANSWLFEPFILKILAKSASTNAMIRSTTAFTKIEGGIKENVLPLFAKALVNVRSIPGETNESIVRQFKKKLENDDIEIKITENNFDPSGISSTDSREFKAMSSVINYISPESTISPYLTTGITDSRYYQKMARQIYRFCPIEIDNDALKTIHGVKEKISIESYLKLIKYFYALMEKLQEE